MNLRDRLRELFEKVGPGREDVLDELRPLYADDVHFQDPMQSIDGRDAFLATNRRLLSRARALSFTIAPPVGTDEEFFLTWTMRFAPLVGPTFEVEGVSHLRARDGAIVLHRDYWDMAGLLASGVPGGAWLLRSALRPFT